MDAWTCRISDGSCVPRPVAGLTGPGTGRVPTSLQTVYTRSDIAYSVGVLSSYCSNLGPTNCNFVVQVFQ